MPFLGSPGCAKQVSGYSGVLKPQLFLSWMGNMARCLRHMSTHFLISEKLSTCYFRGRTAQKKTLHQEHKGLGANFRPDTH